MITSNDSRQFWFTVPMLLMLLMLASGCETNDGVTDRASGVRGVLSIDPSAAVVEASAGQSVTFTVAGGRLPYRWQLNNTELGTLTAHGERGVYSVRQGSGANMILVTDAGGNSASARIVQGDISESSLTITPAVANMSPDQATQTFTASGGQPPYQWALSASHLGTLQAQGDQAVYTRGPNGGALFVRVRDSLGHTAGSALTQEPPTPVDLDASAVPATLANDGDKSVLTASGGTPPYRWSVTDVALGSIIGGSTGSSTVYVRDHSGDNIVVLSDADNTVFHLRIEQP